MNKKTHLYNGYDWSDFKSLHISDWIYLSWLLTFPFYLYPIYGTLSADNILAPIVLISILYRNLSINDKRIRPALNSTVILYLSFFLIFSLGQLLSSMIDQDIFNYTVLVNLKLFLYFVISLLYVNTLKRFKLFLHITILITLVGGLSAFLASTGMITLETERYAESRLGREDLQKAIGVFSNYGDLAILSITSVLVALFGRSADRIRSIYKPPYSIIILLVVAIGMAGSQSRNILLTVIIGALSYLFFRLVRNKNVIGVFISGGSILITIAAMYFIFFVSNMDAVYVLSELGKTHEARATVSDRLSQYTFAWSILENYPIFGNSILVVDRGIAIHNFWLFTVAKGGLVSFAGAFLLYVSIFTNVFRKKLSGRYEKYTSLCMAQLTGMLIAIEFYPASTSYVFLTCLGAVAGFSTIRKLNVS